MGFTFWCFCLSMLSRSANKRSRGVAMPPLSNLSRDGAPDGVLGLRQQRGERCNALARFTSGPDITPAPGVLYVLVKLRSTALRSTSEFSKAHQTPGPGVVSVPDFSRRRGSLKTIWLGSGVLSAPVTEARGPRWRQRSKTGQRKSLESLGKHHNF